VPDDEEEELQPPPPLSELPPLGLAPVDEPPHHDDVWEDDGFAGLAPVVWVWTKRALWVGALLVVGSLVAVNRDAWFPRAAELGERTLSEVDEQVRTSHFAAEQQKAVEAAAPQLPHLAPETIRLVMASSPIRVLDTLDVFEIALDAADRGVSALSIGEARELADLRRELVGHLRPSDRERLSDFDRARARGDVFPLDARQGLRLYTLGARELPPQSLERLRVLLGEAVAAGLRRETTAASSGEAVGP
jgi:hypothetical protein